MGLFGSKADNAQIAEWHGRSRELADAGGLSWKVVWEALMIDPVPTAGGAMAPIGLRGVHVPYKKDSTAAYQGTRHGRTVHVRTGELPGRGGTVSSVWVGVSTPNFSSTGSDGHVQTRGSIDELMDHFASFAVAPRVWHNLSIYGGPYGVLASRVLDRRHPQDWIYDLWLVERVADICEISALTVPGEAFWELPYGVPSAVWS